VKAAPTAVEGQKKRNKKPETRRERCRATQFDDTGVEIRKRRERKMPKEYKTEHPGWVNLTGKARRHD